MQTKSQRLDGAGSFSQVKRSVSVTYFLENGSTDFDAFFLTASDLLRSGENIMRLHGTHLVFPETL